MSSLPSGYPNQTHQQTGFSNSSPNQTSQIFPDFHAVKTHRKIQGFTSPNPAMMTVIANPNVNIEQIIYKPSAINMGRFY
jgi:hypothetical protein